MTTLNMRGMALLLAGAAVAPMACSHAWAQEAPQAQSGTLEAQVEAGTDAEIVVTALRRQQRLQDVPAAVSVLSGDELNAKATNDLRDYLTTVPGVNFGENNVGGVRVTIRGVSDGVGATDPLSGIYIDEAPVTESTAAAFDPDIYDVERVEVLKGPQGTLYGSGAMGGTVRIITKKPRLDRFEGSLEGSLSSIAGGGTLRKVDGVVNAPLLDDMIALRVSAGYRKDGGWIDDLPRNDKNANTIEKKNVRAQLLFKPAERTSITLGILYQDAESGLPPFDDLVATFQGRPIEDYQSGKIYRQSRQSEATLSSLTFNQEWDGMALTAASNYLTKNGDATFDLTTGQARLVRIFTGVTVPPTQGLGLIAPTRTSQFTQEIRLASTGNQRIGWLIGGFYSDVSSDVNEGFDFSQAPVLDGVLTSDEYFFSDQTNDTRQIAGFGELTYNITDKLSLTGGLRVFDVRQRNVTTAGGLLNDGDTFENISSEFSSSTKKALLQYKFSRDHMVYAQAVEGYRNGGPNSAVPLTACGPDLAANGYATAPSSFGPDTLWNYELGSKNTLFGGKAQANVSAFLIKWSKIQNSIALACGLSFVDNAGEAESKGFDIEGSVRPLGGLTLAGSLSYVDAELTEVARGAAGRAGDPLPLVGKWSWNVNAVYEHDITDSVAAFARGEVNFVDDRWNTFRSITARAVKMADYTTVSARLGIQGENWSAALVGTNLTNKRYVLFVNPRNYENVGRPRTLGVEVRVGF